ncbi:cytochrome c-type biogenesis protein CcmH [Pseudomonadota bacterium]|jgi:cytochrome c-type biogenesis protein CcmH|uniref:Cytochrome c-type biogenesis protein n=1 Tax=SAR86 cluster bacterium TaxID=2030880 RepID=A0A520LSZ6_9GAMM|nr:cytochrome c-type biogenesis protein CcmH [Pseudomonadota bacterium]MDC0244109.1 cytochrome c-type biogenesis protein CcmH [Pseudomonadota bacterium]RZO12085.1 MAG: cytochrome c-type biogenesis protein CcmH [SAR86 cluster bacterium]|tara:strand:+ start:265 stop:648 length:384 start_codon:yes stop_codon:yes gene_type:complete
MMIRKYLTLFSFFILSTYAYNQMVYEFEDSMQEKRFYSLISEIRCPKCTSGSIASSDVPVSRDLKNKVYELILDGSTDAEIKKYVSERFGSFSNYRPALEGSNYFLWFGPFIFLALMLVIFFIKRRV